MINSPSIFEGGRLANGSPKPYDQRDLKFTFFSSDLAPHFLHSYK